MAMMIDYDAIAKMAKRNSEALDVPKFNLGMWSYRRPAPSVAPTYEGLASVGNGGFSLGAPSMGGEGGNSRSYIPGQDMAGVGTRGTVPETTYELPEQSALEQPTGAPAPNAANDTDAERQKVEQLANGTIDQLLEALRMMASMEPGVPSNPVFLLDARYKESDAMTGIPGTVAQYPTAGGFTRETEYRF